MHSLIRLIEPEEKYIDALLNLRNDFEVQYSAMSIPKGQSADDIRKWIEKYRESEKDFLYLIIHPKQEFFIGYVQLNNLTKNPSCAKMGIVISKENQGKGYGRAAIELLLQKARMTHSLKKIILEVLDNNMTAKRLYLSLGFREVGFFLNHFDLNGRFHHVCIMEKDLRTNTEKK